MHELPLKHLTLFILLFDLSLAIDIRKKLKTFDTVVAKGDSVTKKASRKQQAARNMQKIKHEQAFSCSIQTSPIKLIRLPINFFCFFSASDASSNS